MLEVQKNPSYREVAYGKTGHAEVIKIEYDDSILSLEKFWKYFTIHDPTTLNRQGADVGTQYRSIILCENENDADIARKIINDLDTSGVYENKVNSNAEGREGTLGYPIVTEVVVSDIFYQAEDYHQDYFNKNPEQAYCQLVIAPKMEIKSKFNIKYLIYKKYENLFCRLNSRRTWFWRSLGKEKYKFIINELKKYDILEKILFKNKPSPMMSS